FFFQAEDGIRDLTVTGVQTCALPISLSISLPLSSARSVLVFESTPAGRTAAIAAATLSASRPPARMTGTSTASAMRRLMLQSCEIGRASCRERVEVWELVVRSDYEGA